MIVNYTVAVHIIGRAKREADTEKEEMVLKWCHTT